MSQRTRRLAAIMYTDMAGYTALGQRNEELSLTLVEDQRKLIRPILGKHNGREVKTMGDAFLVEFPSALDAVRCSHDIQKAAQEFNSSMPEDRRVHLRIGIHIGDVVESGGDILGDAVNVASRIEKLAEDGGVCVTRQVYDHVHNKFDAPLMSLGLKSLKNVAEQVEVYKMVMPWEAERPPMSSRLDAHRIAVLPFSNMSPDPNDEYFSDGMTEELITSLSGLKELVVIARTSVMRFKKATKSVAEIGRELDAGTLVEGSVRKAGNKVRISVQLIDTKNEGHLWAESYDRSLDDIFAIQNDVAKRVAEALKVKLLSGERRRLEKAPTQSIEAYTLYLKGKYYADKGHGNVENMKRAIAHFEEAVADDPNFAMAYADLGWCYNQMGFFGMIPSKEAGAKAKEYVRKALELDDSLAEAHHVNGRILRNYDWDFQGAEREFRRAIELTPSFAEAYGAVAMSMSFNRRFGEAVEEGKRALELDPTSGMGNSYAGTVYLYAGRNEDAIEQFKRALEVDPQSPYARGNLGLAYFRNGEVERGIEEIQRVASSKSPSTQNDLAYAYGSAGRVEDLRKLLERLLGEVGRNSELTVAVAGAYANLGDSDRALEWLERAFEEHIPYLVAANSDFVFDRIRQDPRFQDLMRRIGWTNTF